MTTSKVAGVVLSILVTLYSTSAADFPEWFRFGASSAAYQIEGAWNVSDKGESITDHYIHSLKNNDPTVEGANGDIACDSYHLWERDVEMAGELGLNFYRFSISWPRLLPNGLANNISEDGTKYYNNLIDGLLAIGVEPVVTLYQMDLPQRLQNLGGWTNPKIVEWFSDYARVAFSLFGDRVKTWVTINSPVIMCDLAYDLGVRAPGIIDPEIGPYECCKNVLLAHASAYRIYDEEFRSDCNGLVSISNELPWYEAYSSEYQNLTDLVTDYYIGCYTHPIFSEEGGWPSSVETFVAEMSAAQGYPRSRMPIMTEEEIEFIKGTYDFFPLGHFTSHLVREAEDGEVIITSLNQGVKEINAKFVDDPSWPVGANNLYPVYPEGLRKRLAWLKENYGDLNYFIFENGYSTNATNPDDDSRISYIGSYLEQILLSINEDGVNVTGYGYWSLMDSVRWTYGTNEPYRYGLYEVDFSSTELTRTARGSAEYYKGIIKNRTLG